jgi:hypothetical protein
MAGFDPMASGIGVEMEMGFLRLVIPGLGSGITPDTRVRGDPRIKSGDDDKQAVPSGQEFLRPPQS